MIFAMNMLSELQVVYCNVCLSNVDFELLKKLTLLRYYSQPLINQFAMFPLPKNKDLLHSRSAAFRSIQPGCEK